MLISKFHTDNIDESIKLFENKYGFEFPSQYRAFLKKYNGGKTPKSSFKLSGVSSDISGFYGMEIEDSHFNYSAIEQKLVFGAWIKDRVLPIAPNAFGDHIMLGIGNDNYGKVYFHYHDKPNQYIELAENFKLFVNKCKSQKIGHIRTIEERKQGMIENGLGDKITPASIKGWQAEINEYANIHQEELILD